MRRDLPMPMRALPCASRLGALLLSAAALVACSSDRALPSPTLISVEPASAFESSRAEVIILGDAFLATAQQRLGFGVQVNSEFQAWLGGLALEEVRWLSPTELAARVPGTLPPGSHALEVSAPNGAAELPNAFAVLPCPTGQVCAPWWYTPSNFNPLALSPSPGAAVDSCTAQFSTTTESFVVNTCGLQPNLARVTLSDGREATLLAFGDLNIGTGASLTLTGDRPAILAVFGNARIDGSVMANSTPSQRGAGSTAFPVTGGSCVGHAGGNGGDISAGGGGAGYRHAGGGGGSHLLAAGGAGGTADPAPGPMPLRAGCPGGSPASQQLGSPGAGGGAFQISVSGELFVSGVLSASGAGGNGGDANNEAGYGGGSGGTLVLEGDRITLTDTAKLTANGGGGGGGAATGIASGGRGADGATASAQPAGGGTPTVNSGTGGSGGAGTSLPVPGGSSLNDNGAGGGGGSAGAIFVRSSPTGCSLSQLAVVSPPATFTNCP
jgi:hypothetical protein